MRAVFKNLCKKLSQAEKQYSNGKQQQQFLHIAEKCCYYNSVLPLFYTHHGLLNSWSVRAALRSFSFSLPGAKDERTSPALVRE